MPVLVIIPLVVLAALVLWALLLPVSLWMRYRTGRARRRAQAWVIGANAWLLLVSTGVFVLVAWITGAWVAHALRDATLGLALGIAVGIVSLWLTRFETDASGFHYTPNRWLVLGLTLLVAARIAVGMWMGWRRLGGEALATADVVQAGGWLGVGGVLLGYYLAYLWGLRARLRRIARSGSL
jgi:hypothetical protein